MVYIGRIISYILALSMLSTIQLSAQNIDSLLKVNDTATGKNKIRANIEISKYYWKRNPELALDYAKKLKPLTEKFPEDTSLQIEVLHATGDAYFYIDNIANSLDYGLRVLHLQEKAKDSSGLPKTLNNLGVIYSQQGKLEKALEMLNKSLQIRLSINETEHIASNYNNFGQVYYKLHEDSIAMEYFLKSVAIREKSKSYSSLISGYNNIAAVYMRQGKFSDAVLYLTKALNLTDTLNVLNQKPVILFNLGDIFYETGEKEQALNWYKKALIIAQDLQNYYMQLIITEKLSSIYKSEKKYKDALYYSEIVSTIKDTINERSTDAKISQLEHQYNTKEQELKIKNLQSLNEIESDKNRNRINLLIILALLAIIIIILIINRYSLRSRHNKRLRKEVEYRTKSLVREINERKRLQNESLELSNRFANIFNNSPMAIVSLRSDGTIQLANKAFQKLVNIDIDTLQSTQLDQLIPGTEFSEKIKAAIEGTQQYYEGKITFIKSDKPIFVKAYFNYYNLEEIDSKGIFVTIEDVSEQLRALRDAASSKKQFEELADQLPEMLVETDLDGHILYANKLALERFGFTKEEVAKNFSVFDLLEGEDKDQVIARFMEFKNKKKAKSSREYSLHTRDGKIIKVIISVNVVVINGEPQKLRGIVVDVTERRKYEEDLMKARDKAIEADHLKSKFLQNLSHEIRTPMNGILGFSELIKNEEMSDKERKSYIDFIINASNQLLNIIDDIVNISRIDSGEVKISENEVSLQQLFNNLMVFFHGYLMNRNDKVSLRLKNKVGEAYDKVMLAEKQVQHVLSNLLYNAIRFTKEGYIEIGVEIINNNLRFYIKDTGIGVSKVQQEKIFERFYQVNTEGTKSYGGTGLGLTIAKALVELLNGKIGVISEVGNGSEFFFTVPLKRALTKKVDTFTSTERKVIYPDWSQKKVLIVEDDLNNYLFLEQLLKKTKANLNHVVNGKEAVEFVKSNAVDIILMDIMMPVMNGYEATKEIRKFNKEIPILAQTANAMVEDKQKSLDAGCSDYVSKPVNKKVLLNKIETLLQKAE
jgi:PAS domain S-box-containing protein